MVTEAAEGPGTQPARGLHWAVRGPQHSTAVPFERADKSTVLAYGKGRKPSDLLVGTGCHSEVGTMDVRVAPELSTSRA